MRAIEQTFSETEVVRALCKKSLFEFVKEFWDLVATKKFKYNWHIEYLATELQIIAERAAAGKPKEYDLIINVAPGSTKTILTCMMLPAWTWARWPHLSFIGASYTHPLAMKAARQNRVIVRSDKYKACFPEVQIIDDQDAKHYYVNTQKGERMSVGIGGDITGRHADFLLVDDPIDPQAARSQTEKNIIAANEFITETLMSRATDMAVTPLILIMQRLHQNDPTGMMLRAYKDTVRHICLPAELTDKVTPKACRKFYRDGLMNPGRHPREVLERKKLQGQFYYSGQFLQDPVPPSGGMFKVEQFRIEPVPPDKKFVRTVRYWDIASSKKDKAAYTAGVKMARNCDGRFWVLDVKRGRWGAAERRQMMRQTAETDGHSVLIGIEQEPGSGGLDQAEDHAKALAGFRVRLDRPTGDKALRADPYAAQANIGNVSLATGDWNGAYIDELTYFPDSTYKDQADGSSGAFKLLTRGQMGFALLGAF